METFPTASSYDHTPTPAQGHLQATPLEIPWRTNSRAKTTAM
jgi:hypothetical protein